MQTVRVRLRKPNRVFTFLCKDDVTLGRDDACIVRSDRGLEYGLVVMPPERCGKDAEERFKMNVVRRASDHDNVTYNQLQDDERRARQLCQERIRAHNLAMKLVEVEYTFDRKKIIFYFTAEERVDFRSLVRDLAQELKARIELRHIQVRDEAKMIGGIGTCGRELCCTTWLKEFMPISMKMAKRQNLSLNPSKISGQCGRLMCCLSYENEMYKYQKRLQKPSDDLSQEARAAIRDEMEDDMPEAAVFLSESTLKDIGRSEQRRGMPPPGATAEALPDRSIREEMITPLAATEQAEGAVVDAATGREAADPSEAFGEPKPP
ncbi:MAG: regulatory iron-sulfur-containing complex subunit RicT, partial [Candidatus Hydrogenedentales bacterium]